MKTLIKITFFLMLAFTINSCASLFPVTESYTSKLNTWNMTDINTLITHWGPPSDVYIMPNGNKMYTWLRTGGTVVTSNYDLSYCKTSFVVNTSGLIIDNTWQGDNCDSY